MWRSVLVVTDLVTPIGWAVQILGNVPHVLAQAKCRGALGAPQTHVTAVAGQVALCVLAVQIHLELVMSVRGQVDGLEPHHANPLHVNQRKRNLWSAWWMS